MYQQSYYLWLSENPSGPYTQAQIEQMLKTGHICHATLFAPEGAAKWEPIMDSFDPPKPRRSSLPGWFCLVGVLLFFLGGALAMDHGFISVVSFVCAVACFSVSIAVAAWRSPKNTKAESQICIRCGSRSAGKSVRPGSDSVEVLLWCFFLLPGIIYSAWRSSSYTEICPVCSSGDLIPINSARGQKLVQELAPR
jgi:hypothetical protein